MKMTSRHLNRLFSTQHSYIHKASYNRTQMRIFNVFCLLILSFALNANTHAQTSETQFFQGFETDASNWFTPEPARTASGTNGINASTGGFYGDIGNSNTFTRWGGYNTTFPTRGYTTSIDMYLDVNGGYANDTRLDYSSAINKPDNTHLRDFIFSVGFYNDGGPYGSGNRFVMSASNNSPGNPRDAARTPFTITTSGWYKFKHRFYDSGGGILAVEMSVIDSVGTVLSSWTLSNASDIIGSTVGGNRYGWFPVNGFPSIAIDNTERANFVQTFVVDDDGMASDTDCDASNSASTTISAALALALPGDRIKVCSGIYPLASTINVNKAGIILEGVGPTRPVVQIPTSTGYGFSFTADNISLLNFEIQKTDLGSPHNMMLVNGNNFTADGNLVYGPNPGGTWNATGFVSRGFEVAGGKTGLLLQNNTINTLRQPAYINASSGDILTNNVSGTKGWVVDGSTLNFSGNTFGEPQNQDCDIALLASVNPANYPDLLMLSATNDNAFICGQFAGGQNGRANAFVDSTPALGNGSNTSNYTTITEGINGVLSGGTVQVADGTYLEDININKFGVSLIGQSNTGTIINGPMGGDGATVRVTANNVTVANFTITREGNNPTDWNNATLNFAGVAVQGQATMNMLIRDNNIIGNRTAIDVNNSNGHTIRNNVIDNNHTGLLFRNQTDNMTVVENFITNNRTVGILFLDASSGSNSPVQTALNSRFNNNSINGNWYGEVVDRQTGGSLPAPATTNFKDFRYNWLGSTSPVVSTANSAEPGYASLIPVSFGGTATDPGGQPDIAGAASANVIYTPLQTSGTDTDIETVTGRGTNGFQGATSLITVKPSMLNNWLFYNDENDTIDNSLGSFVPGPATSPLGVGSTQISVSGTQRRNIATYQFAGTVLSNINTLRYSTYNPSAGNGGSTNRSGYLQFNVDFDGSDTWQRRLTFLPSDNGTVTPDSWQEWDAINNGNAVWRYSGGAFPGGSATTKTWSQILADYPGVRIRVTDSFLGIRVGEPYNSGYTENIDAFKFGTNAGSVTFDFEPARPTVTINQAASQVDPTSTSPINFTVVFSEAVTGFDGSDVTVGGTAGATTAVVTGSGTTYNVAVSGMTGSGTVTASVVDSAALSVANSSPSAASTSTDNSVTYFTCNQVTIPTGNNVPTNTQFVVPINVDDTTGRGIISYDFTLNYNPAVVIPIAVENTGTLSSGWTITTNNAVGNLIVSGFNTAPLSGSGILLNVKFISVGGIGTTTGLNLPSFMFNEGIPCTNVSNGDVTVISGTVSGKVTYGNSVIEKPVVRTTLNGTGSVNNSTMTDLNGLYNLSGFGSGAYTVTPTKSGDVNGITAFDSAMIAQHVVGLTTLNATQGIVADVSANSAVTSFDAALIAQYVVAIPNSSITGTWKFAPVNRSYTNVETNQTNQNYQALLMGEVSGNWTAPASFSGLYKFEGNLQPDMVVAVNTPNLFSSPGASLTVPLQVQDTTGQGIISYQYDLAYDANVITPQGSPCEVAGTLSSMLLATCNPATPGLLRVAVFGSMPLSGTGVLMNLKFTVVGTAGNTSPLNLQQFMFNEGVPASAPTNGQVQITGPTAASVGVGGRLMNSTGQGVPNARVTLTDTNGDILTVNSNSFGYYRFENVQSGQTYVISVQSRNYTFTPQTISVVDNVTNFDLIAEQ